MARPHELIQKSAPFGRLAPRRTFHINHDELSPVVRIAHRSGSAMRIAPRIIFDYEYVLIESGSVDLIVEDDRRRLSAGQCVLIPPFCPHALEQVDSPIAHVAVHFDYAPKVPPASSGPNWRKPYEVQLPADLTAGPTMQPIDVSETGRKLFGALLRAWALDGERSGVAVRGVLMQLIVQLARGGVATEGDRSSAANRRRMHRALDYIEANLTEPTSVAQLSEIAGVSESHFSRLFRRHTGLSVVDHVTRRRIALARDLLGDVDLSIKQVAARCGYEDAYYFSRVFRRVDGLSPSQYRQALLVNGEE